MKKLLPLLLAIVGVALGGGAGHFLRPHPEPEDHAEDPAHPEEAPEYLKLANQFVVPILQGGRVVSMVILSLSLEIAPGTGEQIYAREPKLRDAFLQVLFDHANMGGFAGDFTETAALDPLRQALREAAAATLGALVSDVLIADIVRQDG
jgi:flagellar basal body-associated protein FliL